MNRRRIFVVALALLLAMTVYEASAFPKREKRIPGFHVIKDFPETMAAGSTYETELMFLNPKSKTFWMDITLEITKEHSTINPEDFSLEGTLYTYDAPPKEHSKLDISFTQKSGGTFQFEDWVEERFNHLILRISLSSNLVSGKFTFTLAVTFQ